MTVPKEITAKVEAYCAAQEQYRKLNAELQAYFAGPMDNAYMEDFSLAEIPAGEEQNEGEWCDQWTGYAIDDYHGVYYYPTADGRYVAINYSC